MRLSGGGWGTVIIWWQDKERERERGGNRIRNMRKSYREIAKRGKSQQKRDVTWWESNWTERYSHPSMLFDKIFAGKSTRCSSENLLFFLSRASATNLEHVYSILFLSFRNGWLVTSGAKLRNRWDSKHFFPQRSRLELFPGIVRFLVRWVWGRSIDEWLTLWTRARGTLGGAASTVGSASHYIHCRSLISWHPISRNYIRTVCHISPERWRVFLINW